MTLTPANSRRSDDDRAQFQLNARGLLAESLELAAANAASISVSGTMNAALVGLRAADQVGSVAVCVTVNGATLTLSKVALYTAAGVLLGSSADASASFTAGSTPRIVVVPLASTVAITADGGYYLAALFVGTTPPTLQRGAALSSVAAGAGALGWGNQAGLADIPSPAVIVAATNARWLAAVAA